MFPCLALTVHCSPHLWFPQQSEPFRNQQHFPWFVARHRFQCKIPLLSKLMLRKGATKTLHVLFLSIQNEASILWRKLVLLDYPILLVEKPPTHDLNSTPALLQVPHKDPVWGVCFHALNMHVTDQNGRDGNERSMPKKAVNTVQRGLLKQPLLSISLHKYSKGTGRGGQDLGKSCANSSRTLGSLKPTYLHLFH